MDQGQVELFQRARAFLASGKVTKDGRRFARNVRIADVVAVLNNAGAAIGTLAQGTRTEGAYSGANTPGANPGPLDANGNMPTSAAGVVIASWMQLPLVGTPGGATQPVFAELQSLWFGGDHVVNVAGTDVVSRRAAFNAPYASTQVNVFTGPLMSSPEAFQGNKREPEPLLVVKPGERLSQLLRASAAVVLTTAVALQLGALVVVADEGQD